MEKFLRDYGDRLLAFVTAGTGLAVQMKVVPIEYGNLVMFVGALATLAHTIFVKSSVEKESSKSG